MKTADEIMAVLARDEIQEKAFDVLHEQLGITNLIRFMQQYDKGYGNYTVDRVKWQKEYTVDSLFEEIDTKSK